MNIKQFKRTEDGHLLLLTPEERKLLILDLTSRIEYGVICMIERVDDFGPRWRNEKLTGFEKEENGYFFFDFEYGLTVDFAEKVSPYLRPMSSMTEEEKREYTSYCFEQPFLQENKIPNLGSIPMCIDWLNAHHFDYRGLIEKGLALIAPDDMYTK